MMKYKIEYRLFSKEPLLTTSTNCLLSASELFSNPVEFCDAITDFVPGVCQDMVDDFIDDNPSYAGKTFWVQQNAYRLVDEKRYERICFTAFRVGHFPAE